MDAALVFTWKSAYVGREKLALEFAAETIEFWAKKATDGRCTEIEWYFSNGAPVHFSVVKGEYDYLRDIVGSDEFVGMASKGTLLLDEFHYYTYFTGDRGMSVMGEYAKVGADLGLF